MRVIQILEPRLKRTAEREFTTERAGKIKRLQARVTNTVGIDPTVVRAAKKVLVAVIERILAGRLRLQMEIFFLVRSRHVDDVFVGNPTPSTIARVGLIAKNELVVERAAAKTLSE
jgi:hypothetical protein